jgi:hypothetical protein
MTVVYLPSNSVQQPQLPPIDDDQSTQLCPMQLRRNDPVASMVFA